MKLGWRLIEGVIRRMIRRINSLRGFAESIVPDAPQSPRLASANTQDLSCLDQIENPWDKEKARLTGAHRKANSEGNERSLQTHPARTEPIFAVIQPPCVLEPDRPAILSNEATAGADKEIGIPNIPRRAVVPWSRRAKNLARKGRESKPLRLVRELKLRPGYFRNEGEWQVVNRIADLFDERGQALRLLMRNIKDGHIRTPDRAIPIREFLRFQIEARQKRQESGVFHSGRILERTLTNLASASSIIYPPSGPLPNLDQTEGRRDGEGEYHGKYGKYALD